jgi:acyl-coenzyme A thioesterase PaaI-like protein
MPRDFRKFDNFTHKITNPLYLWFFMITKLPAAFFSGVRLVSLDENECSVSVRHTWFTKNPFKSIYFACLAMAAEMSTGVLAMGHTYKLSSPVRIIVSHMKADFMKKARGKIIFTCKSGVQIMDGIRYTSACGKTAFVETHSYGTDRQGDHVAHFIITWAFKVVQE